MMTYCLASNLSANHCNLSHILHQRYHTDKWRLDKPQCIRQYISFYKLWAIASAKRQICNDNNLTHTFMHWRCKYADNIMTDGWALWQGQVNTDLGTVVPESLHTPSHFHIECHSKHVAQNIVFWTQKCIKIFKFWCEIKV